MRINFINPLIILHNVVLLSRGDPMKNPITLIILSIGTLLLILSTMTFTTHIEARPIEPPIIVKTKDLPQAVVQTIEPAITLEEENKPVAVLPNDPLETRSIQRSPYKELLERNSDYRGWINVPNSDINYPFVKGLDNDYYLKRSFDRSYDDKGTVFMDYRNLGFGFSQHILLYGHNMKDGSMFGTLKRYKDADYALENTIIEIEDLYGTRSFKIYASYYAQADSQFITTTFEDDNAFTNFIDGQLSLSDVAYGIQPNKDDNILTLVTCTYEVDNGRYFVHAVELP